MIDIYNNPLPYLKFQIRNIFKVWVLVDPSPPFSEQFRKYAVFFFEGFPKCLCQKFVMPTFNSSTVFLQFLVLIAMVLVEGCFCSTQFQFIDFMDKDPIILVYYHSTLQLSSSISSTNQFREH